MENLFLVCLIPPVSIVEDIDEIRNDIAETYKVYESLKRPVHITLYPPVKITSPELEERFFNALSAASFHDAFEQVLNNFSSFPPHTFYLNVVQNPGIMNLQSQINQSLNALKIQSDRSYSKFTPHITLAFKDVKPPVFNAITEVFKDRKFKRNFTVPGFSVYRHTDKKWQPFKVFPFKNPKDNPKNKDLFS